MSRPQNTDLLQDYNTNVVSSGAGSCADVQFEANTKHCLITYRPSECLNWLFWFYYQQLTERSSSKPSIHHLCAMNPNNSESLTCDVVETFDGSLLHRSLSKNCIFQSSKGLESSLIVSTVDDSSDYLKVSWCCEFDNFLENWSFFRSLMLQDLKNAF